MRKTKIICTLGPASINEETIKKMLKEGMDVARVNFSHGDREEHGKTIDLFRKVRDGLEMSAAVMLDTKGPEIRTRDFEGGKAVLQAGETFTLTTEEIMGDASRTSVTYKSLPQELKEGDEVLIDDGKLRLKVIETTQTEIACKVIIGGEISNHKGINVPNVALSMEYLSPVDREDLLFGIKKDVDYVAASFVRRADDVIALRKFLTENGGGDIKIISKIENIEGIDNFEEILEASDGIMVARGDMGVEVNFARLPGIQKRFIKRCQQSGKIVITATQMLESMIKSPLPTRAEITDVANAVFDGSSAVMLSGETAMGAYPVEAVAAMAKIAMQAEQDDPRFLPGGNMWYEMDSSDTTNAVGHAACTLARDINAKSNHEHHQIRIHRAQDEQVPPGYDADCSYSARKNLSSDGTHLGRISAHGRESSECGCPCLPLPGRGAQSRFACFRRQGRNKCRSSARYNGQDKYDSR